MDIQEIKTPDDPSLDDLCRKLQEHSGPMDDDGRWPAAPLEWCGGAGVHKWFLAPEHGGFGWSDVDVLRGYLRLSAACMTTTFVLTQRTGACRRIAASDNPFPKEKLLPSLAAGERFATVGISHLTTSRRHLARPVLRAVERANGFVLDGYSPWVTGADHADVVVLGATLDDGRQLLAAVSTDLPGVVAGPPQRLIGLSASHTGRLDCHSVEVGREWVLFGPAENVMAQGIGAKTGGLETSCLAIGLSQAAIDYLVSEAEKRPELVGPSAALVEDQARLERELLALGSGGEGCTPAELRARANSLALRATQAALAAAKGTGYVLGHPAGRWCREALFFLVWSCPQPVVSANLCELAGLASE